MAEMTPAQILAVPMGTNDSREETVGGYLAALLELVWDEGEGFDGKRPFGNSGWHYDLHRPLAEAGLAVGTRDRYGDMNVDHGTVDRLVKLAISALRNPAPVTPADLERAAEVEDALADRAEEEAAAARHRAAVLRAQSAPAQE